MAAAFLWTSSLDSFPECVDILEFMEQDHDIRHSVEAEDGLIAFESVRMLATFRGTSSLAWKRGPT